MINDEIDWSKNCLTGGIHNGRSGSLWNLPLGYAIQLYSAKTLKDIVIARIYSDATQMMILKENISLDWADKVKETAEERYMHTLQHKVGELSNYYKSDSFKNDHEMIVRLIQEDKLNPGYEPLHSHDTINLLCRILGISSMPRSTE